jgi:hypothetical protein
MKRLFEGLFGLVGCLWWGIASSGGVLSLASTPMTVQSGEPQSWMNRYTDWPTNHPTASACPPNMLEGCSFAVPKQSGAIAVTTSNDGTNLVFRFVIPDSTRSKPDAGEPLDVGDTIVVQIDADGDRAIPLEIGGGANTDYRYEIVIGTGVGGTNAISSQSRRTAMNGPGGVWFQTDPMTSSAGIGFATLTPGASYDVTLTIPLLSIGTPAGDIGLAILVVNDLGHTNVNGKSDLTAVTFPFGDMPASSNTTYTDPGLLDAQNAGPPWTTPNHWGRGVFNPAAAGPETQLSLSHAPSVYFSSSLKVSVCDEANWGDIDPATVGGSQSALASWYQYHAAKPCSMGVWVNATNSSATTVANARLLILWADGGLGANDWRVVQLTPPIAFGPGQSVYRTVWSAVPSGGSTTTSGTHPCLKVFILPTTLNKSDPTTGTLYDAAKINAIDTGAEVNEFQRAYGFQGTWTPQVAQLNFNYLAPAASECTNGACVQVAQADDPVDRLLAVLGIGTANAQPQPQAEAGGLVRAIPIDPNFVSDERPIPDAWFGVNVQGFAVADMPSMSPYTFIEHVGGIAWAIPYTVLQGQPLSLGFNTYNPPLLYRDVFATPMQEISSGNRRIFLSMDVSAPPGSPTPQVTLQPLATEVLTPGQTVATGIDVAAIGDPPSIVERFIACLRAGNLWCWLVVAVVVLAILALLLRRRTGP